MYEIMKKFISTKYYATKEEAQAILDVFLVTQKITPDQYAELSLLAEKVYAPPVVEEPTEPGIEELV